MMIPDLGVYSTVNKKHFRGKNNSRTKKQDCKPKWKDIKSVYFYFYFVSFFTLHRELKARTGNDKFTMAVPCTSFLCLSELSKTYLVPKCWRITFFQYQVWCSSSFHQMGWPGAPCGHVSINAYSCLHRWVLSKYIKTICALPQSQTWKYTHTHTHTHTTEREL